MREPTDPMIRVAFLLAGVAMFTSRAEAQGPTSDPLKDTRHGVTVNTPAAFPGYTLVAPMNSTSTYLIDMEGRIVNEWKSDYTPALSAYLLENGQAAIWVHSTQCILCDLGTQYSTHPGP